MVVVVVAVELMDIDCGQCAVLGLVAKGFTNIVSPSKGVICLEGAETLLIKDGLLICPSRWVAQLLKPVLCRPVDIRTL